jgi:hypothetical protein
VKEAAALSQSPLEKLREDIEEVERMCKALKKLRK